MTLEFKDIILLELAGHFHQDQFRATQSVVTHIVPSLSMQNGNNPGFRVLNLTYDEDQRQWRVADYEQYYMDLVEANRDPDSAQFVHQYRFSDLYKAYVDDPFKPYPDRRNMQRLLDGMHNNQKLYQIWQVNSNLFYRPSRAQYVCGITAEAQDAYEACVAQFGSEE